MNSYESHLKKAIIHCVKAFDIIVKKEDIISKRSSEKIKKIMLELHSLSLLGKNNRNKF